MLSIFCAPARYVQGRNATEELGFEMTKLGLEGPVFIVAGRSARKLLDDTWQRTFMVAGLNYVVHDFGGECSREEIDLAKKAAQDAGAQVIVGAGGGKVLDTSRAVASELNKPAVNCPTVASSDAPCSALSVVYKKDGEFDSYFFYKRNPDLVLVDTAVIAQAPPRLLVAGMGDALATWFEAKTVMDAKNRNQVGGATTISAGALARLCYETLLADGVTALESVRAKVVTPALERLVEANTLLSGLGFESGGLAIAHSVHNGLTTNPHTHKYLHGEKVAFGLLTQLVAEGKSQTLIDEVMHFCCDVGLPVTLSQVGIDKLAPAHLMQIAERACAEGETAHNEPFTVTPALVADAIVAADKLGQSFLEHKRRGN
ncbi:MAG: glycerol dehydrogenase [Cyanobacteria bacterium SZAS LIN-2]|nr:glycerol dehydrogenase [Cyanobacteria bacterium SZAS LIN-2]MBS2010866.1 glycerol dehydrogenase [Cyanobacteria bacterium SZAS TMP-1]